MNEDTTVQTKFGPLPVDEWMLNWWNQHGWPDDDTLRQMVANGAIEVLKPDVLPVLDPPLTLVRAVQTSIACPSQWDAWDAEGNYYYLRYRSGCGSIDRLWDLQVHFESYEDSETGEERYRRAGEQIASFEYGHPLDGCIELAEFCELTGVKLAEDADVTGFGRYLAEAMVDALSEVDPEGAAAIREGHLDRMQAQAASINTETGEVEL